MRKLISTFAAAGFLVAAFASTASAMATPAQGGPLPVKPAPATQMWAPRQLSTQPGQQSPVWLRLDVEQLTPRVITAGSANTVTVSGKIVNVGDRKISDIELRLERGKQLTSEDDVRSALREPAAAELIQPRFTSISESLEAGQSQRFSLEVPLRGDGPTSMAIDEPGIYPILANVNGTPDFGGRARLAALSTLLPVLAVPGGVGVTPPATPAKLTVLWPLVDRPRLVTAGVPGQSVLTDDQLSVDLALGGRLHSLLKTYGGAMEGGLGASVCLALDPDLLRTVAAMAEGYLVRDLGVGKGQDEAGLWLDQLRRLTVGRCVLALPYADADLVALSRAKLTDLGKLAIDGTSIVQEVLAPLQPLSGVVWPGDGVLDQQTLTDLTGQGVRSVLLDQSGVTGAPGTQPVRLLGTEGIHTATPVTAVRIDSMISDALLGGSDRRPVLGGVTTPSEAKAVSVQNALAALVFRAGFQGAGQNLVVAPPRRWNAPAGEMAVLLDAVKTLFAGQFAVSESLGTLVSGPMTSPEQVGTATYPVEAGAKEVPPAVTARIADSWTTLQDMSAAMIQEDRSGSQPADLVNPLQLDLLHGVSGAWRGNEAAARKAVSLSQDEIGTLRSQVTVTESSSPILLGSGDSPIPVTIKNKLDVRITVRILIEDTSGIKAKQLADLVLPARGDRVVPIPVEVRRSGRFSVNVALMTPTGVKLGDTVRLEVSSSAYGVITIVITGAAAVALVLLSGRRIYRRIRASRQAAAAVPEDANGVAPEKSSTS